MKFSDSLRVVTTCIVFLFAHKTNCEAIVKKEQAKSPIVLFISDDHGYKDAGVYGNSVIKTPNIDRLVQNGKMFSDAFATTPLCSPSR